MRRALAIALLLAGCGPTLAQQEALRREQQARQERLRAAMTPEARAALARAEAEQAEEYRRAFAACRARAEAAQVMHPDRSFLGLEGQAAAGQVFRSCLRYYDETGVVPGF